MQSQPLAITLLIVNCAFPRLHRTVLGEVSENAKARNVTQMDLIGELVSDIRDCRQSSKPMRSILRMPDARHPIRRRRLTLRQQRRGEARVSAVVERGVGVVAPEARVSR